MTADLSPYMLARARLPELRATLADETATCPYCLSHVDGPHKTILRADGVTIRCSGGDARALLILLDAESKMRSEDIAEGQRLRSETFQAFAGMAIAICRLNMVTILARSGETLHHAAIRMAADWLRRELDE